jgi:hypothetical protein
MRCSWATATKPRIRRSKVGVSREMRLLPSRGGVNEAWVTASLGAGE